MCVCVGGCVCIYVYMDIDSLDRYVYIDRFADTYIQYICVYIYICIYTS